MKVKTIIVFIVALLLMMLSSCDNTSNAKNQELHALAEGKAPFYASEKELYDASELVVLIEKTSDEENTLISLGRENRYTGYTLSKVVVKRIIKIDTVKEIAVGDTIPVVENQFSYNDTEKDSVVTYHIIMVII